MTRRSNLVVVLSIALAVLTTTGCGPRPLRTWPRVVEEPRTEATPVESAAEAPAETQAAAGEPDATITRLHAIVARHPRTPQAASALVEIGDLESDRGRVMDSIHAYLRVVCPSMAPATAETAVEALDVAAIASCSPMLDVPAAVGEVWARLGGVYFDEADLTRAEASFEQALARLSTESPTRIPALYRLAWAQFRGDHYAAALESFARVVESPAEQRFRDEALSFLGVIAVESDWDDDGREDTPRDLARPELRAFFTRHPTLVSDVMFEAARTLFDSADYARAIAIDEALLQRAHRMDEVRARITEARRRGGLAP